MSSSSRFLLLLVLVLSLCEISVQTLAASDDEIEEVSTIASRLNVEDSRSNRLSPEDYIDQTQLVDNLSVVPSVAVSRSGGYGALTQLRVRGAEANHTKVLIDGISVNDLDGGFNFGQLNSVGISGAEVLHGPLSSIWGSDAIAGVIALSTIPTATNASWLFGLGSHGHQDLQLDLSHVGPKSFIAVASGYSKAEGFNVTDNGTEKDGFEQQVLNLTGGTDLNNVSFKINFRTNLTDNDYDPIFGSGAYVNEAKRTLVGHSLLWEANDVWQSEVQISRLSSTLANSIDGSTTNKHAIEDTRYSLVNHVEISSSMNTLLFAEYQSRAFKQQGTKSIFGDPNQSQEFNTRNLGVEVHWQNEPIDIRGSARYDKSSEFSTSTAWNVLVQRAFGSAKWYLSTGSAYRHPSFIDRFGYLPDSFLGNPDLSSEEALQVETGWLQSGSTWLLNMSLFHTKLKNEIDGFVYDPLRSAFTAKNTNGESIRRGFELKLERTLNIGRVLANFGFVDSTEEGQQEIRRPRQLASFSYSTPWWHGFRLRVSAVFNGSQIDHDFRSFPIQTERLEGYSLVHVRLSHKLNDSWMISLRAQNLRDHEYQDVLGFNTPGRQIFISARFNSG